MDKENLIKLLEQDNVNIKELTADCGYIVTIDVGNMSKEHTLKFCEHLKAMFNEIGIDKTLIIPTRGNEYLVNVFKVKDGELWKI